MISLACIILLLSIINGCLRQEQNTIYVGSRNADYPSIQKAINAAKNGATIFVKNGSYNELLVINKSINLIGEDKNTTIINFSPNVDIITQVSILNLTADHCLIENLQITLSNRSRFLNVQIGSGGCCGEPVSAQATSFLAGGLAINSNYNTIKNTVIFNVSYGIELSNVSASNMILNNTIKHNEVGVWIFGSVNNTISYNILSSNQKYNIFLSEKSDTNTVSFNSINTAIYGIRIKESQNNTVYKNYISQNDVGVYCCCDALSNFIYLNTFFNNTLRNAEENEGLTNIWYDYPNGNGNYWDDYNGSDENNDGIGDIPYEIYKSKNQDIHPLIILLKELT